MRQKESGAVAPPKWVALAAAALLSVLACRAETEPSAAPAAPTPPAAALRLVELYSDDALEDRVVVDGDAIPRSEWRFAELGSGEEALGGWQVVSGVSDLRLQEGRLVGTASDPHPVIAAERPGEIAPDERIHAVEIRARVSAGEDLQVRFVGALADDPAESVRQVQDFMFASSVPLQPGDEMRTYRVPPPLRFVGGEQTRHLMIRPSNAAGAEFTIESVRVVSVAEHLASLPSGAGWHGLGEIYHESLALRGGESLRLPLDVPAGARLFAELGSLEEGPVRFRVDLERGNTPALRLLSRTLTTPGRWERIRVDLPEAAAARLVLSVESERPNALGYFGNPVLRSAAAPRPGAPRGVILILADTLRRDHLDSYGYGRDTAPRLAARAAEGALFRDAVSQGSWTKVVTPSLVTGLYQSSHGVTGFPDRLPDAALTLAEIFRDAGYATLGYSSVPFTGKFSNMQQGYESFHELTSLGDNSTKTSRAYVDRLLAWIDDHPGVPFFAFLHVFDPHDPFEPRAPWNQRWADPGRREQQLREMEESKPFIAWPFMKQRGLPNPEELERAGFDPDAHARHNRDWYDGSIRGMDAELARVFERLEERGLAGDALVAFTSDHGEEFFEHGGVFHGETLYGEMLDVPLVLWGPGRVRAGVEVDATVQAIDLMPTLLELSGLPVPKEVQGRSLVPLLRGGDWTPRPAVAEAWNAGEGPPSPRQGFESLAIVSGGWKLVHNLKRPEGEPEFELYHRERDPLDAQDVADAFPAEVERLRGELEAWRSWVATTRLEGDGEAGELDPQELERLRELGYLQ